VALAIALATGGCARPPAFPVSAGHIGAAPQIAAKPADIPQPVKTTPFVPAPTTTERPQTYSVVVSEVPVKELLFALARDARRNVDIHPGISGLVTLNAINETLPAILDRVARQVNIRYRIEGDTLTVAPDTPYLKTYPVNYVNVGRATTSAIGVASQIASTGTATTGSGGQAGSSGNSSTTTVNSTSNNNFWEVLAENIRNIVASTKAAALNAEEKATRVEAARTAREERLQQVEAVARAGSGAPNLFTTAFGTPAATPPEAKSDVIVNPVAGTVTVLASERQHGLIQQYLDGVLAAVQRQVLIEATIVEVSLGDKYKAGVDWSRIASGAGFTINQQTLAGSLGAAPNFTIGYANATSAIGNIAATLKLLESFGDIRVLSSPKLMALNNQTALLKVVDNLVYFSIEVQPGTNLAGGGSTNPTYSTTAHTVPVGVVMSVTPQINDSGVVTLVVRPTISRDTGKVARDPNPDLAKANVVNEVPIIQVREMESVLQVLSGQTVILGGLMQDDSSRSRDGVAGLARLPGVGDAFSYRNESAAKTELVIFLRPTTISNPSLESDELKFFRRYLPSGGAADQPRNPERP
jgi:general secretion pathway protein D